MAGCVNVCLCDGPTGSSAVVVFTSNFKQFFQTHVLKNDSPVEDQITLDLKNTISKKKKKKIIFWKYSNCSLL